MTQQREEIDADLNPGPVHFAETRSDRHPHGLICGSCGATVYADDAGYDTYLRSIEYDPDNQFICDRCDIDIETMAHAVG